MKNKTVIISYSSQGRENYNEKMLQLIRSGTEHWDGDYLLYSFDGYVDEYLGVKINLCHSIKTPQPKEFIASHHSEVPYQFKVALFQIALEKGYEQVIWCDSTIKLLKSPWTLLDRAEKEGIIVWNNLGHPLQNWISDKACEKLEVPEELLPELKQIMACVIIMDFRNPLTMEIFEEWKKASLDGKSFLNNGSDRPGFKSHRHDQAILSWLCYKHEIEFSSYGQLCYPPHHKDNKYVKPEDVIFLNKNS